MTQEFTFRRKFINPIGGIAAGCTSVPGLVTTAGVFVAHSQFVVKPGWTNPRL
jgi:hypothetical protein